MRFVPFLFFKKSGKTLQGEFTHFQLIKSKILNLYVSINIKIHDIKTWWFDRVDFPQRENKFELRLTFESF